MENQCYIMENYLMNSINMMKLNRDPILTYTIIVTSINTYFWVKQEKPGKIKMILSYILSIGARYIFFPIYLIGDSICYISNFVDYINKNNLRIL